jgi:magnesium chelatase accessory protein
MFAASQALDFDRDAQDWPNRSESRFVQAAGIAWHVQEIGAADRPVLLLLHGTGAATHSWRGLVPLLVPHFRIVAMDLPGHGFTQKPPQALLSLPGMAHGVCELVKTLDIEPELVAGHSAGAAVMIRMALDCRIKPKGMISLNGALTPYGGDAARILSPIAKLLFLNPLMPRFFAWQAGNRASVERLIRNTGSSIDADGVGHYRTLVSSPDHVAAALGMMANWDLQPLSRDMGMLDVPLLLIAAANDKAIKSEDAFKVRAMAPGAKVEIMRSGGHLAHEEQPDAVAALMLAFAREVGALRA